MQRVIEVRSYIVCMTKHIHTLNSVLIEAVQQNNIQDCHSVESNSVHIKYNTYT